MPILGSQLSGGRRHLAYTIRNGDGAARMERSEASCAANAHNQLSRLFFPAMLSLKNDAITEVQRDPGCTARMTSSLRSSRPGRRRVGEHHIYPEAFDNAHVYTVVMLFLLVDGTMWDTHSSPIDHSFPPHESRSAIGMAWAPRYAFLVFKAGTN